MTRPIWPPTLPLPHRQAFLDASDKAVGALVRELTHLPSALHNIDSISNLLPPDIHDFFISPKGQVLTSIQIAQTLIT